MAEHSRGNWHFEYNRLAGTNDEPMPQPTCGWCGKPRAVGPSYYCSDECAERVRRKLRKPRVGPTREQRDRLELREW